MTIDTQLIYLLIGLVITVFGWFQRQILNKIDALEKQDVALSKEFSKLELLVSGEYIRRNELKGILEAVFTKLDKIMDKLDSKQDKVH